jgi:hypothetical protein
VHNLAFGSARFCDNYKDKSLFVELPCKVGDVLYYITTCKTAEDFGKKYVSWEKVEKIALSDEGDLITIYLDFKIIYSDDIGKTVFLTEEEAKEKLKEVEE